MPHLRTLFHRVTAFLQQHSNTMLYSFCETDINPFNICYCSSISFLCCCLILWFAWSFGFYCDFQSWNWSNTWIQKSFPPSICTNSSVNSENVTKFPANLSSSLKLRTPNTFLGIHDPIWQGIREPRQQLYSIPRTSFEFFPTTSSFPITMPVKIKELQALQMTHSTAYHTIYRHHFMWVSW